MENNGNAVPLQEIVLSPSQQLTVPTPKPSYPQAFTRVASIPLAQQAAEAAMNSQATLPTPQITLPPYFIAPPPGYKGPLPPPPPPPPLIPRIQGEDLRRAPLVNTAVPLFKVDSSSPQTANTPYYPPTISAETLAPVIISPTTSTLPSTTTKQALPQGPDKTGFERGRSEVKTSFFEDSGLMVQALPSAPVNPPSSFGPPGGGGAGFGG
ncbi:unnamed protein product [Cylicostephanus goldi]|uniref:Uncharacterized protein n=1 Tax=Cylicostephanus goldi TaxID=71465 RepID=A0A3P6SQZ3_CYLGO|nr:unnamed protein product [Cylicostephanus goldi]